MDESRKRAASNANAKNIKSSLDEDFGNDFLSSWKLPKSGKDTIDFDVESVLKNSNKFSFDNLDDFGLDGAFDKLSSFKMGMPDLDFSSPLKKKVKHNSSNGKDLSEGKKETERDNFSFSFDFNELGKFNLDTKLAFEENGMCNTEKTGLISSEGNKDPQRGISDKGTDVAEDSTSKEQTQTQGACTLKPTHLTREIRNFKPPLVNDTGNFSLLSKAENTKASRPPKLTSVTTLNQLSGADNVIKKTNTHPTDLKREHKHAKPEKPQITSARTYCKPVLQGFSATSLNAKHGLEPLRAGNSSILNAPSSIAHSSGYNNLTSLHGTPSKDDKRPAAFQLTGSRVSKVGTRSPKPGLLLEKDSVEVRKGSPVITPKISNSFVEAKPALLSPCIRQNIPEESFPDPKSPAVLKNIMRSPAVSKSPQTVPKLGNKTILSGTPKACMDNVVSSTIPCEIGGISDLELPALLEDAGNVDKAEACRKELEDMCILLKRKHTEAKELAVRAIVNNNMMLMLNHPMFEEKISALQKYANSLRSKTHLFEEINAVDTH
ncbi:hypothetical protein BRADI_2g50180v3 [Brachypodium distachyon]|uniref:Uncharacterized protein n=1 Tax=Brachypodium distachyon TaxID=15368 RepID=A0A0Q3JC36_BRADI|nr:hypothetical protein BRADI_2g50180v3 [Brachypodium distachyon]